MRLFYGHQSVSPLCRSQAGRLCAFSSLGLASLRYTRESNWSSPCRFCLPENDFNGVHHVYLVHLSMLFSSHPAQPQLWLRSPLQDAERAQVEIARVTRPEEVLEQQFSKLAQLISSRSHQVGGADRMMNVEEFTIRETVTIWPWGVPHLFQKVLGLSRAENTIFLYFEALLALCLFSPCPPTMAMINKIRSYVFKFITLKTTCISLLVHEWVAAGT